MTSHTSRRRVLRGAALATVAALAAEPAIADPQDPIIAWAAELRTLRAKHDALQPRIDAARDSVNGDVDAGRPPLDAEGWSLRVPGKIGEPVFRQEIEQSNDALRNIVAHYRSDTRAVCDAFTAGGLPQVAAEISKSPDQIERECVARLAWWDRRQAERKHNAEVSGYRALINESSALCDRICAVSCRICETPATTLAGALARLNEAATIIRDEHTRDGVIDLDTVDIDEVALLGVVEDLRRFLPTGRSAA